MSITVKNVTKSFGTFVALNDVSLDVPAGEPLTLELTAFVKSLRGDGAGAASARAGRDALAVAEQVREAMRRRAQSWVGS